MDSEQMKARTRSFALRVIRLAESLPNTPTARVIREDPFHRGFIDKNRERLGQLGMNPHSEIRIPKS